MMRSWVAGPMLAALMLSCLAVLAEGKPDAELQPKRVTLKSAKIHLADALKAVAEQTQITVTGPADKDQGPELMLDIDKATFWEALEAIARESDLRINLPGEDRPIALAPAPGGYRELPTSFDGLFRVTVRRIEAHRDLENDSEGCRVGLEIAWEPRFRGFLLELGADALVLKDQRGLALEVPPNGRGQVSIDQKRSTTLELMLPAFKRADSRIGELKGTFSVIGASKLETFTFDKLAAGQKKKQNGVTVELTRFKTDEELWFLDCAVRYPEDGPKFESFQSWLVGNEAYLIDAKGRRLANAGYETGEVDGNTSSITYQFTEDEKEKIALGKPSDWKFVYRTPSAIAQVPVRFSFKDIPLP